MKRNDNAPVTRQDLREATEAIVYTLLSGMHNRSIDHDDKPIIQFLGDYVRPDQAAVDIVQKFLPRS